MSKSDWRRKHSAILPAALLLFVLPAALLPTPRVSGAGGAVAAQRTAAGAKTAAVRAATAEVLRETSEVRQLAVLRGVRSGAQSRDEIERMLVRNLDRDSTPEETRASELTLKKLGLLPADFQLRPFVIRLLSEQVAGYYDPRAREFYLADWIDLDAQKPVIAHELTHALRTSTSACAASSGGPGTTRTRSWRPTRSSRATRR